MPDNRFSSRLRPPIKPPVDTPTATVPKNPVDTMAKTLARYNELMQWLESSRGKLKEEQAITPSERKSLLGARVDQPGISPVSDVVTRPTPALLEQRPQRLASGVDAAGNLLQVDIDRRQNPTPFEIWSGLGVGISGILHSMPSGRWLTPYEELPEASIDLPWKSAATGERAKLGTKGAAEFIPDIVALSGVSGRVGLKAFKELTPRAGESLIAKAGLRTGQAIVAPLAGFEWVIGKTLKGVFGDLPRAVKGKLSDIKLQSNFKKTPWYNSDFGVAARGTPLEQDVFAAYRLARTIKDPKVAEAVFQRIQHDYKRGRYGRPDTTAGRPPPPPPPEPKPIPDISRTHTDEVISDIRAGKFTGQPAPSVRAVQGVVAELTPEGIPPVTPEVTPTEAPVEVNITTEAQANALPVAGETVSGLVVRKGIPNQDSIESTLYDWEVLPDIREIPTSSAGEITQPKFYSVDQEETTRQLAEEIKASGEINPLIIVVESTGDYILEGSHRLDALRILGIKSFPAQIVINRESLPIGETRPQPTPTAIEKPVTPPEAVSEGIPSEEAAVTEVAGVPPKPPKDWDKVGGQLYDRFKQQSSNPTPNTVPVSGRVKRGEKIAEKVVSDEFARLNSLGWQAELDVAMLRASGTQSAEVYKQTMKSVAKSLGNDSDLLSHVDDYLMLRHQLEVLKATGRKYFTIKKGEVSHRFTAKQIGLLFDQMKKELGVENYAKVKEAATHVPAVYNQILRGTQELTPGQIEGLIKKYPWYNPILFQKDTVPANITRKLSPRQVRELTTLESDKDNISPLVSLPTTIAKRMKAQAINDARKSIAELAVDPKNTQLIGGDVEIVAKKPEGAFIDYFDNGKRKYLKLGKGSEWLAKDIDLFQRQPPSMMITMVRSLQNLSKMFFTTYNPGFVAWNTTFDGMVTYFSEGIGPWGYGKALAGNIKAMFVDVPGVNEYRRSGGELFGFFERGSREGLEFGEKEKTISPYVSTKGGRLVLKNPESLKRFLNPFTLIRELGLAGENAGRRATYEKAIKEGLSPKEAALRGRRVIVDFSRFSQASRVINDWFIYFNPAMQGLLLPGRAIAKNPRTLWRLALLASAYAGIVFYNQSYDEYDDVRDSDKVGKLLIMLPSDEYNNYGQKVPHYLTLAPLREFAAFTAPIEYFMGKLRTESPEAYRSLAQEWDVLYPIITPLSMISESGGLVMPTQVGATIQQIISNHDDFRDRDIVDDEMELLPPAQQYDQYTNGMAIRIGQALNMSPKKLDFFVSNMFGALGNDSLRAIDMAIQELDREDVDERIAGLVNELRTIPTNVPPNRIEVARETFLEGLSVEDRELVLNMERLPDDKIPFMASFFRRFIKDYGGQVYQTAKEKALANRTIDDYPPEALEELKNAALENANNLLADKITKYQYDQNRTRYRAYYSGAGTAEWRQGMIEGAVARSDVDKFMPETYKRAKEFQAVSSYMEIREKYISEAGGVLDSDTWDKVEQDTIKEMGNHYSENEIQYALDHKDDWIDKLPEPARTLERRRAREIEDETWWDNYRKAKKTTTPSRSTESSTFKSRLTPPK